MSRAKINGKLAPMWAALTIALAGMIARASISVAALTFGVWIVHWLGFAPWD